MMLLVGNAIQLYAQLGAYMRDKRNSAVGGWILKIAALCFLTLSVQSTASAEPSTSALLQAAKGKVVLLDFWASWCTPCRKSFPWMNTLQKKFGPAGLVVIAVNMDHERSLAEAFLKTTPAEFQIDYDPSGALATEMSVSAMPTSFLLDRSGRIVQRHAGFREAQLAGREAEIEQLLKENTL